MNQMALATQAAPGSAARRAPGLLHGERLAAYRAAVRHSRLVRGLRMLIPVAAAAAVAGLIGWSLFKPVANIAGLEMGPVALSGTKVTMENPKLNGFRKDGKPYQVTSVAASQDVRKPGVVELEQITARLGAVGDNATHLRAAAGVYDMKSEQLQLSGGVHVNTDNGDTAKLQAASVNLKAGEMHTTEPVRITTANGGSVDADAMRVSDNGKVIVFEGRVKTVLYPQNGEQKGANAPSTGETAPQRGGLGTTDTGFKQ